MPVGWDARPVAVSTSIERRSRGHAIEANIPRLSAGLERPRRARGSVVAAWILAVLFAVGIIWLDRWLKDISISLFVVVVAALVLGAIWREYAGSWGLITGVALPAATLVNRAAHHASLVPGLLYIIAFIPSFVGAYMGAFLNKMVSALFGHEDD